jgi:hypothetical protein
MRSTERDSQTGPRTGLGAITPCGSSGTGVASICGASRASRSLHNWAMTRAASNECRTSVSVRDTRVMYPRSKIALAAARLSPGGSPGSHILDRSTARAPLTVSAAAHEHANGVRSP